VQAASEGIKVAFEVQKGAIILLQKALRIRGVQLGVSYFSHQENADFMRDAMVFLNPSLAMQSFFKSSIFQTQPTSC
jgi:hypothetical protein